MEINDILVHDERTFKDFIVMALRYSLGRRTYASSEVPQFIKLNKHCIDERICDIMLVDLIHYLHDRETGFVIDDECDCQSWKEFYQYLLNWANEHNFLALNHAQWKGIYAQENNK